MCSDRAEVVLLGQGDGRKVTEHLDFASFKVNAVLVTCCYLTVIVVETDYYVSRVGSDGRFRVCELCLGANQ